MTTKRLDEITLDYGLCRRQVEELRDWLAGKPSLSEQADVLPFFRARPQMATIFGMFNRTIGWANRIGWEFDIYGDFRCDLAVGEWEKGAYCFVEFENAQKDSVFKKQGSKATREWGPRFDHGYSQIIDWFHKLDGLSPSTDFLERFGRYDITYEAVLVVGRNAYLDAGEKQRLGWRADRVTVNAKKVICMTFDDLLEEFLTRLGTLTKAAEAFATTQASGHAGQIGTPKGRSSPKTERKGSP